MNLNGWIAAGLSACLLLGLCACEPEEPEQAPVIRPVRSMTVRSLTAERVRKFSGSVRAGLESRLSFRVAGTVQQLPVAVGQRVEKGQTIAKLDSKDYQLRVQEAEAALTQTRAQERNASANYERVRALYENRNASRNDLDAARAAFESTRASVDSVEKRLELAKRQLTYTTLRAPVDGAISSVKVEVNENVGAGQVIAVVASGSRPEVEVGIPESLIVKVREGDRAVVTLEALPGRELEATVTEVGVSSTGTATTFPVTVKLDDQTREIRPGMAAEVAIRFESDETGARIVVPPVSVGEDRTGRFVFVLDEASEGIWTARRRPVTVGELSSAGIEIIDGLEVGARIVTAGVSRIRDGQTVRLLESRGGGE